MTSKKCRTYFNLSRILLAFILAVGMVFLAGGGEPSLAASGIWQGAISNIWNFDQNWMPGGYPNAAGEIAFFDGWGAPTNVLISGAQVTVGSLVIINNTGYFISAENGGSLIFESASSSPASVFAAGRAEHAVSAPMMLSSDLGIINYTSYMLKFHGDISQASGAGDLYVDIGAGRPVAFYGANSYSGGTNILGGTLLLGGNTSAGSGPISLLCSTDPCNTQDVPASLGNLSGSTVLQNPLLIKHGYVEFLGPGSMSFPSLESSLTTSAEVVVTGILNLAKLQDPTGGSNLRRSGAGTLNLNITPSGTNIGDYIRSEPGSGELNLYGSGQMGRLYFQDGSGGGELGVGDSLDVASGALLRSTGVLTVAGELQTGTDAPGQADRTLSFDLRGAQAGSGYDQVVITGKDVGGILSTARITDTVLSVALDPNYNPPVGTVFTLLQRSGGDGTPEDAIFGTFRDLPDGKIFLINNLAFQIDYTPDAVTLTRCMDPIIEVVSGTPQSTQVGTQFPLPLQVHVRYPDQSPVVGVPVFFSAPASGASASFSEPIPVVTDSQGNASVTATANQVVGSYQVVASVMSPTAPSVAFELTNLTPGPDHFVLSGFPSPTEAGQTETFTLMVLDPDGQPVTDYIGTVAFSSSDPLAALPAGYTFTLADAGQHTFTATFFTAGTGFYLRATDTVEQSLTGEQSGINVLPASPAQITLVSGSSQAVQVGTPFADALVVRLTDAYNNLVPGVAVTFSAPVSGAGAVFTSTNPALTDLLGEASLVAGANTVAGAYQVTASVDASGPSPVSFSLTNLAGPVVVLQVFGYPSPVVAGSIHPFTVNAVDKYGNINPAYRGSTYSLSSDHQAILPQDYLFTAQDAGSHVFNATFKTAGTHDITIVDNRGSQGTQSGIVVEALKPSFLVLDKFTSQNPQSTQVTTPFPNTLAVILTDIYGNPQSGFTINFAAPASGASAALTGAASQVTGSDGRASVLAAANMIAGSYALLVTTDAPGVAPFVFSLENLPGPAAALAYQSGSPQSATVGKPFAAPLVVRVADAYGNPVSGAWVTFIPPASGPGCVLANAGQAQSDAAGTASLAAVANMFTGTYQVEARLSGVTTPVLFTLTNRVSYYLPIIHLNYSGE